MPFNNLTAGGAGFNQVTINGGINSDSFTLTSNIAVSGSTSFAPANAASYATVGASGTFTGTGISAYQYLGVSDVAAANSAQGIAGFFVNMGVGGGTYQGNRFGIGSQLTISSAPAVGDTSLHAHVALYGRTAVTANLGGSAGSYTSGVGAIWGLNTTSQTTSSGTNLLQMWGYEADLNNGAAINQEYGIGVIYQAADTVAATYDDYGFVVSSSNSAPVSPSIMYAVGTQGTYFPGTTLSTILGVVPQQFPSALSTPKFKYGVDLNPSGNTTITTGGFAFRSPGFTVDPTGNVVAAGLSAPNLPAFAATSGTAFILPSSGSVGNNGALTLTTALDTTYSGGAWFSMPTGAVFAGSTAGFYWGVASSTTAVTLFNNTYSTGIPLPPGSNTPFVTTGPGAYTQALTLAQLLNVTIPGGAMGTYGRIVTDFMARWSNTANSKVISTIYGGSAFMGFAGAANTYVTGRHTIRNNGVSAQMSGNVLDGTTVGAAGAPVRGAVNSAANQTFTIGLQLTNALDYLILENATVQVLAS